LSAINVDTWVKYFPFKTPRAEQQDAINFILRAFLEDGKRFVIADLGTGIGKSAIAVTVARYLNAHAPPVGSDDAAPGAWFMTTQKILQEQYMEDFGAPLGNMRSIRSATNYTCDFLKKNSCSEGQQMLRAADKSSKFWKSCMFNCTYKQERKAFLDAPESVTNFSYALTAANYGDKILRRNLLVLDECHNTETELAKFIEIAITERLAGAVGLDWPDLNTYIQTVKWIRDVYVPTSRGVIRDMEADLEQFKELDGQSKEYADMTRRHEILNGHIQKVETFLQLQDPDNWVFENLPSVGKNTAKITFKPIDISPFAEQYLFRLGKRVLLMSATVINCDIYAESLGLPLAQYAAITQPTPFPVENRPIFFAPIGLMSAAHIDESLPKLAEAVKEILKEHKGEKGIIHSHSYKITNYLRKNLKDKRLIFHDSDDREAALKKHMTATNATVLVSPSMAEGVDLRDDLSRFQIIMKVPYPSLGDKLVKKRMHRWSWWYPMQTIKTIVQAVGRSIRNEKDRAVTYILDADWRRFYAKHSEIFPDSFKKALK
jgi:hypothetical protein